MPDTTLPKPLAASVGLIYVSVEEARGKGGSVATQVVRLPLATLGQLLTAHQRYDELAATGDFIGVAVVDLVRKRLGSGAAEAGDWVGDEFAQARGQAGSKFEQVAEEVETVIDMTVSEPLHEAAERLEPAVSPDPLPEVEITPEPTPLQQLESFSVDPAIGAEAGGLKSAAELPLKDFDHMSGPQLRGRLRTLDQVQLVQLLDYERAHANRVGIIVLLENRLTKLHAAG